MRNVINAINVNVVVDRTDRAGVAGIVMQQGLLSLCTSASYPRAGACATKPGHKRPGGKHLLHGTPAHLWLSPSSDSLALERGRSTRRFTSRRLAARG